MDPKWLDWARRLQALAQIGLTYAGSPYDAERYEAIREIAAEMMAAGSGCQPQQVLHFFAGEQGYETPKVDVRGVVFRDDMLLLVRERSDNRWTLPGGWADIGQSPAESVVREVYEESGYRARPVKLVAVYDRSRHPHPPHPNYIYKMFFLCALEGGEAASSIETSEAGFFREDAIPELSVGRVTPEQIARMFEHYRQPELPTEFD